MTSNIIPRSTYWLLIAAVLLLIPSTCNQIHSAPTENEIWSSMTELIRIPVSDLHPGQRIEKLVQIKPSKIDGLGSIGKRHFQFSIISTGTTRWMQPWNPSALTVEVRHNSTLIPGKPTTTQFYLVSQVTEGPTGLSFDLENGNEYLVSIQVSAAPLPPDCELIFAPNWDNPMYIKDHVVGAMAMPLISIVFGWLEFASALLIAIAIFILFRHSKQQTHSSPPPQAT